VLGSEAFALNQPETLRHSEVDSEIIDSTLQPKPWQMGILW